MRTLLSLLLALLVLGTPPVRARASVSFAAPVPAATPPAPPDTALALHHLFARYRARRLRVAVGTLLVGTGLTIASAASVQHANDPLEAGFTGFGAILAGSATAALVPVELVALGRANRRHERRAIELWQAHQLPTEVRQALRPRDFARPPLLAAGRTRR